MLFIICYKYVKLKIYNMKNLINKEGITIRELKNWIKDLPEIDEETGEEFEVWINGAN